MKATNIGRIKSSDIQRSLSNKLSKDVIMISDKHQSLKVFSKANKIHHIDFKAEDHTTSEGKGVQRLNNIASRIDTLLNRKCKEVSTKYLQLYVNWLKQKENNKGNLHKVNMLKEMLAKVYLGFIYQYRKSI